jgi:uncharacterized membrane protein YphA (DoxX/SURF4 family)
MAGVRVAAAVFFLLFAEYKVARAGLCPRWVSNVSARFHLPIALSFSILQVLSGLVLPHLVFFAYLVGVVELLGGIALLVGLWVRLACLGIPFLLSRTLTAYWEPGPGAAVGRYFGPRLDTLPLLLIIFFAAFFAARAGRVRGLDGRRWRVHRSESLWE